MEEEVTTLDYANPHNKPPRNGVAWAISGAIFGGLLTLPALLLAFISARAGHGHYGFARAVFPFSMLATLLTGNYISLPLIIAGLLQFPLYGLVIGFSVAQRNWIWLVVIIIAHSLAVTACFSGLLPNFS
ncbi:MAG TPA: hypothetical protein VIM11_27705 [Tepidisphaeraceae bacterium]